MKKLESWDFLDFFLVGIRRNSYVPKLLGLLAHKFEEIWVDMIVWSSLFFTDLAICGFVF